MKYFKFKILDYDNLIVISQGETERKAANYAAVALDPNYDDILTTGIEISEEEWKKLNQE